MFKNVSIHYLPSDALYLCDILIFHQNIDSCSLYGSNLIIKRRKKIGKFIFWHKIPTAPITVLRWWWYNTYTSNYYYVLQSNITAASWGRIQFIQNISHTIDIDIQLQKYLPIKYKDCRKNTQWRKYCSNAKTSMRIWNVQCI